MKGDRLTLTVTDLHPDGNGIARTNESLVVFLPLTAPGDVVEAQIIKQRSAYAVGRVEALLTPSPLRQEPGCAQFKRCGGCTTRHMTFEAECAWKRSLVENAFRRIGHLEVDVEETVAVNRDAYRNKVAYPLGTEDGEPIFGYYARHSHALIPHTSCPQQDPLFDEIAAFHVEQLKTHHIPVWNEQRSAGVARHLVMRKNRVGQFSVCFVAAKPFVQAERMAKQLMERFPQVCGVSLNLNPSAGNTILGETTRHLCGEATLTDTLCGNRFSLSPTAFYQVNPDCAEAMYRKAAELAALPENGVLLDLYCGAGTIGLCITDPSQKLLGVEIIPDAVKNAQKNALANGRSEENTHFVCGDAAVGVAECRGRFGEPDVIVVDPPRKGLSEEVIRTLLEVSPERIVYISCDPATLAANCETLCKGGYTVKTAIPYQMFPRTGHIETVCLLERA